MVWTLLNPTEFAQKIDLLLKVPDVAPSTAEKNDIHSNVLNQKSSASFALILFENVNFAFM